MAATGIQVRHASACATNRKGRCSCSPSYRVRVDLTAPDGRRRQASKTLPTLAAAKAWRSEAQREVRLGLLRAQSGVTFRDAAAAFVAGAVDQSIVNRSGKPYKPSAVRDYEQVFRLRLVPAFGAAKLADVTRADLQHLVGRMRRDGLSPSSIRRTVNAARALYRHAVQHAYVMHDPTDGLALPAVEGGRDRVVSPHEARALLLALKDTDRAVWATAMYAGLRYGELRALRWQDVDLAAGVIRVERSWDEKDGPILPKSVAGIRVVPIPSELRTTLVAHRLASRDTSPQALALGNGNRPFCRPALYKRARREWAGAGLAPILLHECRHSYASLMIAAGANVKALQTWMGHASIVQTMDRYGHLLPGSEKEGAAMLDALLSRPATA